MGLKTGAADAPCHVIRAPAAASDQQGRLRHAVGREGGGWIKTVAGKGRAEPFYCFGMNRLGAIERDLPRRKIDILHLVGAIAADAQIKTGIWAAADLGPIIMDRPPPVERALHE